MRLPFVRRQIGFDWTGGGGAREFGAVLDPLPILIAHGTWMPATRDETREHREPGQVFLIGRMAFVARQVFSLQVFSQPHSCGFRSEKFWMPEAARRRLFRGQCAKAASLRALTIFAIVRAAKSGCSATTHVAKVWQRKARLGSETALEAE